MQVQVSNDLKNGDGDDRAGNGTSDYLGNA